MDEQPITQSGGRGGNKNLIIVTVIVVIVILAITAGGFMFFRNTEENSASEGRESEDSNNTQIQTSPIPTSPNTSPTSYKDGNYSAIGSYSTPGGVEQIGASVTLKNNIITAAQVEQKGKSPTAKVMQVDFSANFKEFVVGKNINEVSLSKVSGSSLTSGGFNDALDKIKSQAKS